MTTAGKMVRWANLDNREKANQFSERGQERTARNDLETACVICDKGITGGDSYLDVNGARQAHKVCVTANLGGPTEHGKVITHKMKNVLSIKKAANAAVAKTSKRGRKAKEAAPKVEPRPALAKRGRKPKPKLPAEIKPVINLSEVRESLPGAIITLTITGTVEAVQRALDKLQN